MKFRIKNKIDKYQSFANCKEINTMENNFFTYSQKEQNYGQSEQILLKRKWKEKIVEDDRCMSHFDTDTTLIATLCPALCDIKNHAKHKMINKPC